MLYLIISLLLFTMLVYVHSVIESRYLYTRNEKRLIIIHLSSLSLFALLTYGIQADGLVIVIDQYVDQLMTQWRHPVIETIMLWVSAITDIKGVLLFTAIFLPLLWYKRWHFRLALYLAGFTGGALIALANKHAIERFRPPSHPLDVSLLSYPSGHASLVALLGLFLFFAFYKMMHRRCSRLLFILAISLFVLLGSSARVYLHAHWASDTLGAILLETSWMSLLVVAMSVTIRHLRLFKRSGILQQPGELLAAWRSLGKSKEIGHIQLDRFAHGYRQIGTRHLVRMRIDYWLMSLGH